MRALRILLIIAVVLGGVFVALDRAAVHFAESEAESRVSFGGVETGSTDVSIKGFPFLTQVADSELDRVDVTVKDIRASAAGRDIRISEIRAELSQVTLGAGYTSATASHATGTAVVSYAALTEAADDGVTVAYGGDGKVKVTGRIRIPLLDKVLTRSVTSTVTLVGGNTVRVHADKVPGEGIPGLEGLVRQKTDFERKISGLPDGLELKKIEVAPGGLEISMTGSDVALAG
ncbi:LmeA family phospholipid-binding protein [Streptomyces sp. bgisy091]|uniref:LmeA family phospholipid-binding protein n=1 Tax=Streptomyces sp. bgisy091 TaxID=3413778 RepID=UPI003D702671